MFLLEQERHTRVGNSIAGAICAEDAAQYADTLVNVYASASSTITAAAVPIVPTRLAAGTADDVVRSLDDVGGKASAPRSGGGLVPTLQGNVPQADKWIRNGGRVIHGADGSMTYIKGGVSIRYNSVGYPDFSMQLYKGTYGLDQVRIKLTGSRRLDEAAANAAAGFKQTPDGFTWHHHEDCGLMQLVDERIHGDFWHSGGFSLNK